MNKPWENQVKPFKIIGNVYFVGYIAASSHLIDTGDGLILIDTGYPNGLYLVIDSIYTLGFNPKDVKYIIHTHGHYDHCGATRAFTSLYGGKTFIGAGDEDYVNGKKDLTWARELGYEYHGAFDADEILHDGDCVELGNTKIEILSTPGHTPGTISLFFDTEENQQTYKVGMHGGVGANSMKLKWLAENGLSLNCREQFLNGIKKLKSKPVDVFLGNHVENNDTIGKYKRSLIEKENPFIDPQGWIEFLSMCEDMVKKMIAENR
ncbi:MAG: MBL fold metallo-hydrolase [Clostridia bacterium]|nr:MBL fold metallo-hydrolase [Clostridia bacterium]